MAAIGTKLDVNQVIKQAFDEDEKRLRVDALVTATISDVAIKDSQGNELDVNNDGSINVNVQNALDIEIDAADGDNIAISDGVNTATVTSGGALNVNVVNPGSASVVINQYNEITSVPTAVLSTILSYTPSTDGRIKQVNVSGTNIGEYTIEVATMVQDKAYTYYTQLNNAFDCGDGLVVNSGSQILIRVIHNRPNLGNFNARLQFIED